LNSTAQKEGKQDLFGKQVSLTVGDSECKPVPKGTKMVVNGKLEEVVCTLDGFNVTWS